MMFRSEIPLLLVLPCVWVSHAFTPLVHTSTFSSALRSSSGGDGGDAEWSKALRESTGDVVGQFDADLKMKGLMKNQKGETNPKLTANANLIKWLSEEDVYLSEASGWSDAPHPMGISTETRDEVTNESSGRGLLARRDINDGDELLIIPLQLCVTKESSQNVFGKNIITDDLNEYLAVACQLIHEKYVMGDASSLKAYIDVLPETNEVNPSFTWGDEELDFLQGSPIVAATKSLQMKLQREYDALLGPDNPMSFTNRFPKKFPKEHFTHENWIWAFTMLFSRAIRLRNMKEGESLAMVPYADLINHSPFSGAYIDARESGSWLFKVGGEEVILYADRGYRRMEQIYISYGQKSNAELLLLYGFAVERNPFNSVDVTVAIGADTPSFVQKNKESENKNKKSPSSDGQSKNKKDLTPDEWATDDSEDAEAEGDPLAEEKVQFLQTVGRNNIVDFPCYADRYPTEMLEYLRLMQMTPEDSRGKPLDSFDYSRTISEANEAAVLKCVVTAVKQQLTLYPNTEEQDATLIRDKGMFRLFTYNQRMAVRHRRNEKRLLKRTIAALEKQIISQGLDAESLQRAGGSTLGKVLPGDAKKYGMKQRTALEDRLEKMGLPVDLR